MNIPGRLGRGALGALTDMAGQVAPGRGAFGALDNAMARLGNAPEPPQVMAMQPRYTPLEIVTRHNTLRGEGMKPGQVYEALARDFGYASPESASKTLRGLARRAGGAPDLNVLAKDWGFDSPAPLSTFLDTITAKPQSIPRRDLILDYIDHRAEGLRPGDAYVEISNAYDIDNLGSLMAVASQVRKAIRDARAGAPGAKPLAQLEQDYGVTADQLFAFADDVVSPGMARANTGDRGVLRKAIEGGLDDIHARRKVNEARSLRGLGQIDDADYMKLRSKARSALGLPRLVARTDWAKVWPDVQKRIDAGESYRSIEQAMGLPVNTVARRAAKAGMPRRGSGDNMPTRGALEAARAAKARRTAGAVSGLGALGSLGALSDWREAA